ncbi:hypothetical protein SAMN05414139_09019 [Burkholderia sp. D7]|nr:hypothetical protein SAMN05414139_09019 [Burkholderia sp. D7]
MPLIGRRYIVARGERFFVAIFRNYRRNKGGFCNGFVKLGISPTFMVTDSIRLSDTVQHPTFDAASGNASHNGIDAPDYTGSGPMPQLRATGPPMTRESSDEQ